MANLKKIKLQGFKFKPFSAKQLKLLTWWQENSPVRDKFMIVADGSIRAGKTVAMILSFVLFVMKTFNQQNAAMCGKSVGSFRRNVLVPLKQMLLSMNYDIIEHRSENYVEIIKGDKVNYFYIFGAKDESSQDLIQGITLCALMLDEVALMPESFYNQATARLSVEGAKCFCNCNPNSPYHWFYRNVLRNLKEKDGLYVHFTMKDNLSLSKDIIERYEKMYSGVFYNRYIEGRWVVANGLIYDMFSKEENIVEPEEIPYEFAKEWCIGVDYGTGNATCFLLCMKTEDGVIYVCKEYYFAGRKEAQEQNDFEAQKTDLEFAEEMRDFITENYDITDRTYRQIEILVDPAASSFKLQLRRFHMKAKNAVNDVLDGIRTVATYMGKGDLKISTECPNLIQELHTYMWDEKAQLRGQDSPVKVNDHAADALRYSVMRLKDKSKISNATRNLGL